MKISVIIPAYNEERYLAGTIAAVRANRFPEDRYEIIVVDNGSTDHTGEIARRCGVRLVACSRVHAGAARNLGARQARGEILAFLDADCLPAPDWLLEGLQSVEREPCITGAVYEVPETAGWIERAWFSQKRPGRVAVTHINAGNLFVPRDLFFRCGGFDPTLPSGEDYEFCRRAREQAPILADDRIRVVHLGNPKTARAFVSREIWHGLGALASVRQNPLDKPFLGTVAFGLLSMLQLLGLAAAGWSGSADLLAAGTMGVFSVLATTVLYRLATGSPAQDAANLFFLYYLYYFGRSIALAMIVTGQRGYQRSK